MQRACALAAFALAVALAAPARADTLTVFAAASLKESLDEAARAFESASGAQGAHLLRRRPRRSRRQIEAGAPGRHLHLAPTTDWIDYVEVAQARCRARA